MNNGKGEDLERVLFSEEDIAQRIRELGRQITADYQGKDLVVLVILKGSVIFAADLVRTIDVPLEMDFVELSSYGNKTESSGEVQIVKQFGSSFVGRHVLVVEDIIDSGLTLHFFLTQLQECKPASLEVAALVRKQRVRDYDISCAYVGFECPNEFIVGYGLDYAQKYRNLGYIGVLRSTVIDGRTNEKCLAPS